MEKFRKNLFKKSEIEKICNFLGVYPTDYYSALEQPEEVILFIGYLTNMDRGLEALRADNGQIKFSENLKHVVYEIYRKNKNKVEVFANIYSILNLLSQTKRIKIVLFGGCYTPTWFLKQENLRYLLKHSQYYKNSIGLLIIDWFGCGLYPFSYDYLSAVPYDLEAHDNVNRDLVNILLTRDSNGTFVNVKTLSSLINHPNIMIYREIEEFVNEKLQFTDIRPDDFRLDSFHAVENVYNEFADHIKNKTEHLAQLLINLLLPAIQNKTITDLFALEKSYHLYLSVIRQLEYNETDLVPHNLLECLKAKNITNGELEIEFLEYIKKHKAYYNANKVLTSIREKYTRGLPDEFDNVTQVVTCEDPRLRNFQEHVEILQAVGFTDKKNYYELIPVKKMFQDLIFDNAQKMILIIEVAIKNAVIAKLPEILNNFYSNVSKEVEASNHNSTNVLQYLEGVKEILDQMVSIEFDTSSKAPFFKWKIIKGTTYNEDRSAQLTEVLWNNMFGARHRLMYYRDYFYREHSYLRSEAYVEVNQLVSEFKQNKLSNIVQTMTKNNVQIVDEIVQQLCGNIELELLVRYFKKDDHLDHKDEIDQQQKYLKHLQNHDASYYQFLKLLKEYFQVHYISMPTLQLNALEEVKKDYEIAENLLGSQHFKSIDTKHNWGENFVIARINLAKSKASSIPSVINQSFNWCIGNIFSMFRLTTFTGVNNAIAKTADSDSCDYQMNHSHGINLNSFLLLLDLVARKVFNWKPQPTMTECPIKELHAQAEALNIVAECEEKWSELMGDAEFDFSMLQQQIKKNIGNLEDMKDVQCIRKQALDLIENFYLANLMDKTN
jgi:hypothetical protein